jgi:hypothetical protein
MADKVACDGLDMVCPPRLHGPPTVFSVAVLADDGSSVIGLLGARSLEGRMTFSWDSSLTLAACLTIQSLSLSCDPTVIISSIMTPLPELSQ